MRVAVFASGGGSNFQAIVDATKNGSLDAEIVLCVSNRATGGVVDRARTENIPVAIIRSDQFEVERDFSKALLSCLRDSDVDLVALAGYLKKIPPQVIKAFPERILNIHPALLPRFGGKGMYGMHVHESVIRSGAKHSGATVHLVDDGYDTGSIVLQRTVPILETDTPEDLAARVLAVEHDIFPEAIQLVLNRLRQT